MKKCLESFGLKFTLTDTLRFVTPILFGTALLLLTVPAHGGWFSSSKPTVKEPPQALKAPPPPLNNFSFPVYYQRLEEVRVETTGTQSSPGSRPTNTMPGFSGLLNRDTVTNLGEKFNENLDSNLNAIDEKFGTKFGRKVGAGRDALTDSLDRLRGSIAGKRFDLIKKNTRPNPNELREGANTKVSADKKYSYKLTQTRVTSEEQLLRLMGVGTDTSRLTNGQQALLEIYRESKDPQFVERMKYGFRDKVSIQLSDTNGHTGENIVRDFWPCSYGELIQFSDQYFANSNSGNLAKSVLVHEAAHSLDKTILEYDLPYGPDGCHYQNELDKPKAAFIEGWAEYAQFLHFPEEASYSRTLLEKVRIETTTAGSYTEVLPSSLTGAQLLRVEGINAWILLRIARGVPNGPDKVLQSFSATNTTDRTLSTVVKDFIQRFPEDAGVALKAFDTETLGKLSDAEILSLLGNFPSVTEFLAQRKAAVSEAAKADPASLSSGLIPDGTSTSTPTDRHPVQVDQERSTPYGE